MTSLSRASSQNILIGTASKPFTGKTIRDSRKGDKVGGDNQLEGRETGDRE